MTTRAHVELTIRLHRTRDGSASLTCIRADGSTTWQRQAGSLGLVFPAHDLTHYAVETTLGYRLGFYGLIADGWNITDFTSPWPRGEIPPEAREVELIVGVLDMERRMGGWSAAEFREQGTTYVSSTGGGHRGAQLPSLTDEQFTAVQSQRDALLAQWASTPAGGTIELYFSRA